MQFSVTVYKTVTLKITRRGQTFFSNKTVLFFDIFRTLTNTNTRTQFKQHCCCNPNRASHHHSSSSSSSSGQDPDFSVSLFFRVRKLQVGGSSPVRNPCYFPDGIVVVVVAVATERSGIVWLRRVNSTGTRRRRPPLSNLLTAGKRKMVVDQN